MHLGVSGVVVGMGEKGQAAVCCQKALETSWERSGLCMVPILPWPSVKGRGYNGKWMKTKLFHWNFCECIRLPCFVLSITMTPGGQGGDGGRNPSSCWWITLGNRLDAAPWATSWTKLCWSKKEGQRLPHQAAIRTAHDFNVQPDWAPVTS